MEGRKRMVGKKKWIATALVVAILGTGGIAAVAGSTPATPTHEQTLERTEKKFGKPPATPTTPAVPQENPGEPPASLPAAEALKATLQEPPEHAEWQKEELRKQQETLAKLAPSPMPTGHDSFVAAGKAP